MKETLSNRDAREFRDIFNQRVRNLTQGRDKVYLSLSGGIDSSIIFFSLIEQCIPFEAVTFRTDRVVSSDFRMSEKMCKLFHIPFNPVIIPTGINELYEGAKRVVAMTSKRKKTIIECCYPFLYIYPVLQKGSLLLTGLGADDLYCNQRKLAVMLHAKGERALIPYRKTYTDNPDFSNGNILGMGAAYGIDAVDVYNAPSIIGEFLKYTLKLLNQKHKSLSVSAYADYFNQVGGYREHASFQVNSKLREDFEQLLSSSYNDGGFKSVTAIYNRL